MKKITLLLFAVFFSLGLYAQRHIDRGWAEKINPVFEGLNKEQIPTGLLLDYAMEFTDVQAYNGRLTDSTAIDLKIYSNIYKTLFMGKVNSDINHFPPLKTIAQNWATKRLEENEAEQNTLVLSGLYYQYAKIAPNALEENKIEATETGFTDKYIDGQWQNPYLTQKTLAFSPPIHSYNRRDFEVVLPEDLFLSNVRDSIATIEVNFGDGNGFQSIGWNEKISVHYQEDGEYEWIFKLDQRHGESLFSSVPFRVVQAFANEDIEEVYLPGATLRIDYAPSHNGTLQKPFIVAEGFDTGHILTPEKPGGDTTLKDFQDDIEASGNQLRYLLEFQDTQQYDIVYIDWKNGTDMLQNNSAVLEGVLDWVNTTKTSQEQNVLLGQSMGGVIGRYTLARMEEEEGKDHEVHLFVSHDAPLQGSNTPLSTQFFSRHFHNEYVSTPQAYLLGEVVMPLAMGFAELMSDVINALGGNTTVNPYVSPGDVLTLQDTPAAMQMNYEWVNFDEEVITEVHEAWQQEFEAMGYPENCRNIAISNGNECGNGQGFSPGDLYVQVQDEDNPDFFGDLVHLIAVPTIGTFIDDPAWLYWAAYRDQVNFIRILIFTLPPIRPVAIEGFIMEEYVMKRKYYGFFL